MPKTTTMKHLLSLIIVLGSLASTAQQTTETFGSFTKINVFGPFEVELVKSEKDGVEMDFMGFDRENIIREVSKGELTLKLRNKHYMNEWTSDYPRAKYVKVKIYYTELHEIRAQAGAVVFTEGELKSKNLALHCGMGAEMRMEVISKNLFTKVTMGAVVDLEGQTEILDTKVTMGGVLKASSLKSKTVYVNATMGSEVYVYATDQIEVNAGFGAEVNYTGGANVRHTTKNFGADVREN